MQGKDLPAFKEVLPKQGMLFSEETVQLVCTHNCHIIIARLYYALHDVADIKTRGGHRISNILTLMTKVKVDQTV